MANLRDYMITLNGSDEHPYAKIYVIDNTLTKYKPLPTFDECEEVLEASIEYINIRSLFKDCANMLAAPSIIGSYYDGDNVFGGCLALKIAPRLPNTEREIEDMFKDCTGLIQAAVLTNINQSAYGLYRGCSSLIAPVSIPQNVKSISYIYENCTNLTGEFVVRGTHTRTDALKGTIKPLVLYGNRTTCEGIAATANNGNASWSPWYDPTPAVTDRGQGSRTTADDLTRMVRNGALAVNSYAPGRMVYHQGDIVRADEWDALVEAAQTIDPTVTKSTHYTNLNKIEKAFDDAL